MKRSLILCLALLAAACTSRTVPEAVSIPAPADVVMYQVNPRNFASENAFQAVDARLDAICDLGTNVVWFMPICEIGIEKAVKSPYCVKDYRAVNPEFGTLDDFKTLVSHAHAKGMAVIIDWVANHTSWDNAWITEHPDWYTHDEDGVIIHPAGTGWNDVADLNFDNPQLCQAMIDAMKFWVEEVGVDGFRCDAADYVPFEFWKDCVAQLRATGHDLLMLAEGQRKDHFEAGFDMNYAWGWLSALRRVYTGVTEMVQRPPQMRPRTVNRPVPVSTLFAADSSEYAGLPAGKVKLRFTTNHDEHVKQSPVREFFGNDGSLAAFVATAFIHGGILVYGCQEVGYPGKINFFNPVEIDWNANPGMVKEYKDLIALYKSHPALRQGALVPYPHNDVLTFERKTDGESILVMVNLRDTQIQAPVPTSWQGRQATDLLSGKAVSLGENELLRPFEYLIAK
ncbi:MAG: alpha-glucosidase C-terminal domain-containing protein [Bacteroidales bacterium]|nr:alpha-glucosidase C-terminal domain-containing protein [Bacteroidales bacterium]